MYAYRVESQDGTLWGARSTVQDAELVADTHFGDRVFWGAWYPSNGEPGLGSEFRVGYRHRAQADHDKETRRVNTAHVAVMSRRWVY